MVSWINLTLTVFFSFSFFAFLSIKYRRLLKEKGDLENKFYLLRLAYESSIIINITSEIVGDKNIFFLYATSHGVFGKNKTVCVFSGEKKDCEKAEYAISNLNSLFLDNKDLRDLKFCFSQKKHKKE